MHLLIALLLYNYICMLFFIISLVILIYKNLHFLLGWGFSTLMRMQAYSFGITITYQRVPCAFDGAKFFGRVYDWNMMIKQFWFG